jgi:type I restriction enzyme R subunit
MPTDTTEKGLETLIMHHMTGTDGLFPDGSSVVENTPDGLAAQKAGGSGWHAGSSAAFDRAHCIDVNGVSESAGINRLGNENERVLQRTTSH